MKRFSRLLALLTTLMLLAVSALAETAPTEEPAPAAAADTVAATVNGTPLYLSELQEAYNYYANQGYDVTYDQVLGFLVNTQLLKELVAESGYDQFTDEERAQFDTEAAASWDEALGSYVSYYLTEDTEEARATLREQAEQYYRSIGYSPEVLADSIASQTAQERYLASKVDADSVTREDVENYLNTQVAEQQAQVQGSVPMYEMYQMYMGTEFMFTPEGYRRVLHILMSVDDALMSAYTEAKENWESLTETLATQNEAAEAAEAPAETEAATAEEPVETEAPTDEEPAATEEPEVPVTQEMVDEAYQKMQEVLDAVIASKQSTIEEIETRLAAGEEFAKIAPEYNEDPGEDLSEGYMVHPESIMWDPVFRDAAFSEEMAKPGDHSKPVVGSHGIHILYYLDDVPAGPNELTDELYDSLYAELISDKQYDVVYQEIEQRAANSLIVRNTDLLSSLDGAADDVEIGFEEEEEAEPAEEAAPAEETAPTAAE